MVAQRHSGVPPGPPVWPGSPTPETGLIEAGYIADPETGLIEAGYIAKPKEPCGPPQTHGQNRTT